MNRRSLIAFGLLAPGVAHAAGGGGKKKDEPEGTRSYVVLETLTASIMRPSGQRGVITIENGIDVPDADLRARAELSRPRLRAAYLEFTQPYVAGLSRAQPVNADYLARQLQRRTDTVLGRTGAKFLLGSILMN